MGFVFGGQRAWGGVIVQLLYFSLCVVLLGACKGFSFFFGRDAGEGRGERGGKGLFLGRFFGGVLSMLGGLGVG